MRHSERGEEPSHLLFLLSSRRDLLLPSSLFAQPKPTGCPILRNLIAKGGMQTVHQPLGRCTRFTSPKTVISTEAAHGLIVNSVAEKSDSLPKSSPASITHLPLSLPTQTNQPGAHPSQHHREGWM
jgi:hypothetical protein